MIQELLNLVSNNKLEEATKKLEEIFKSSHKLFELVQQKGRLKELKDSKNLGIIKDDDFRAERNKVRWAIISIIQEIDDVLETNTEINKEIQEFNKKNIQITQNHFGSGNNVGGDIINGDKLSL